MILFGSQDSDVADWIDIVDEDVYLLIEPARKLIEKIEKLIKI